jgi:hypothetical protein
MSLAPLLLQGVFRSGAPQCLSSNLLFQTPVQPRQQGGQSAALAGQTGQGRANFLRKRAFGKTATLKCKVCFIGGKIVESFFTLLIRALLSFVVSVAFCLLLGIFRSALIPMILLSMILRPPRSLLALFLRGVWKVFGISRPS